MIMARYLTRMVAGAYLLSQHELRRSPKDLAKLAMTGGGPAFPQANRAVLYDPVDLDSRATETIGRSARSTLEHCLTESARAT